MGSSAEQGLLFTINRFKITGVVSRHNRSTTENMKAELSHSARLSTALGWWGTRSACQRDMSRAELMTSKIAYPNVQKQMREHNTVIEFT